MGTNFYVRIKRKPRERDGILKRVKSYINEDDFEMVDSIFKEGIDTFKIHLGKRSVGWKFLFNANRGKYYDLTKEGITKFVESEASGKVVDEYGREFTIEDFWEDEIKDFLNSGYDLESYYKEHPEHILSSYYCYGREVKELKRYNPNKYGEFYNDGLRFTTCDEFS